MKKLEAIGYILQGLGLLAFFFAVQFLIVALQTRIALFGLSLMGGQ